MKNSGQMITTKCEFVHGNAFPLRSRIIETQAGAILLRKYCAPSFVESLTADSGLNAFARRSEREQQLLVGIAKIPDSILTLAYTSTGVIVGQVTIVPVDGWWEGLRHVYEISIEVSSNWRRQGIAHELLAFALDLEDLEDRIIVAMGLSWHWDMQGLGLSGYRYRQLIARLFAVHKFDEYLTSEPNIALDPANIFLARIGNRVSLPAVNQFLARMLDSPVLPGFPP